ncbi:MAG TPA: hypothetical protein VG960_11330 [Caulobacteraceae bacterium]|nr:hypothetical protein [Caulobacteraceae bacterium]
MATKFKFESLGQPFEADWPVLVPTPVDGGKTVDEEFMVRWRRLPADQAQVIEAGPDGAREVIRQSLVKVYDDEKDVMTPELVEQLLGETRVRLAFFRSLNSFAMGAAVKN